MIKWGLISKYDFSPRFDFLSSFLSEHLATPNEWKQLDCSLDDFPEKMLDWQKEFDQLRVGPPFGSLLASDLDRSNALTMTLKTADSMQKLDGAWWPRSLLDEALLRAIVRSSLELDIHTKAMIIGTGASAKAAIMPLVKVGYTNISFTDSNSEKGYEFVRNMSQRIFNVKFEFVEQKDIALLPGVFGFVINTTPDVEDNTLLDDLSYFNYLKSGGVAVDLAVDNAETQFIGQASLARSQVIAGLRVAAEVDCYWMQMCFDLDPDVVEYEERLSDYLKEVSETKG